MKIDETYYISQRILYEFELIKPKTQKRHGYTSEATSQLVVERVIAGKQKVFRGAQKTQTSTEAYPVVILADWSFGQTVRSPSSQIHAFVQTKFYMWLLKTGYQVYAWSDNGPIPCSSIHDIINHLNCAPLEKINIIKSHCLKIIGDCTVLDFDKMEQLAFKLRMTSAHSIRHTDILIESNSKTLENLMNQTESLGLILDNFTLSNQKTRVLLNAYLREYGTDHLIITKEETLSLLIKYCDLLNGNAGIKKLSIIFPPENQFTELSKNCDKIIQYCQASTEIVMRSRETLSVRFKIQRLCDIYELLQVLSDHNDQYNEATTVTIDSFLSFRNSETNAKKIREWRYIPPPIAIRHLRISNGLFSSESQLSKIIDSCTNLNTLYLENYIWSDGSDDEVNFSPKNKISKLVISSIRKSRIKTQFSNPDITCVAYPEDFVVVDWLKLSRFIRMCPGLKELHLSNIDLSWSSHNPFVCTQHLEVSLRDVGVCQLAIQDILILLPNLKGLELDYHAEFTTDFIVNHVGYFKFMEYIRVINTPEDKKFSFIEQAKILFPLAKVDFCTEIGTSTQPLRYRHDKDFNFKLPDNSVRIHDADQISMNAFSNSENKIKIESREYAAPKSNTDIDTNTQKEKIDYHVHQHFLGPGAQHTTQYRLQVNLPTQNLFGDLGDKIELMPFCKTENAYAVFNPPPESFLMSVLNIFKFFPGFQKSPTLYLGQATFTLSHEWQSLPSYLPYESITHIECQSDIILGKNAARGLHYVKLRDQQSPHSTVTLRFVFQELNRQASKQFLLATRDQALTADEINLISGLALNEDLSLVDNEAAKYFANLSDQEKILTIRDYIDYFEPGETLGVDDSTPYHQRITAIFAQRKGSCRHRASCGFSFLNALSIITRNPTNAAHSFTEVYFQGTWCTLDLGGAPGGLIVLSKPFEGPMEKKEIITSDSDTDTESPGESDSETEWNELSDEANIIENKTTAKLITPTLLSPKLTHCPTEISSHSAYLDWLLQTTQCLQPGKSNHLIVCPTTQDLQHLVYELQTLLTKKQYPCYFIDNLDSVVCKSLRSDGQHYEIINSELIHFLQGPGLLLTDWTEYNEENIGFNSMYVDQPTIKGHAISQQTRKIALITEEGLANYGDDFTSRFQFITQLPIFAPVQISENQKELEAFQKTTKSVSIALNNSNKWSEKLLGRLVFLKDKAMHKPGALEKFVHDTTITDIELLNPPSDDKEFDAFYRHLKATNRFFCNGIAYKFHDRVRFILRENEYDFTNFAVTFQRYDKDKSYSWDEILSPNTTQSFYNIHQVQNGMTTEQDGYLKQFSGRVLTVMVTQNLAVGDWMELLSESHKQNCQLHCLIAYNVSLPNELDRCATWKKIIPARDRKYNHSNHYTVDTNDTDFSAHMIHQENPGNTVVICLSEDLEASDLIGQTSVKEISSKLHFSFHTGALIALLNQGKNVVLKGRISASLADALAPLWSATPHLWCNGTRVYPKSLCIIVTENNLLSHCTDVRAIKSDKKSGQFEREQTYLRAQKFLSRNAVDQKMALLKDEKLSEKIIVDAKDCDKFDQIRINKVMSILQHQPCMFMLGKTGSGKSTLFRQFIKGFEGVENILNWAKASSIDGNFILLFIDEANMLSPQMLTALEGIFSPTPGLLYQGQWYPLTSQHKILFAANPLSYGGRCQHKLWENRVLAEVFEALPPWYVEQRVLTPLAQKLNLRMIKQANSVFLSVYELLYQDDIFTPRNCLQMMLNLHLAINSSINLHNIDDVIRRCAYDEAFRVTRGLDNADVWMEKVITALNGTPPELHLVLDWNHFSDALQKNGYYFYTEHQKTLETLHKHLALRELKLKTLNIADCGINAMVIEGDSGIGKSTLAVNYLEFLGFKPAQRDTNNDHSQQKYYLLSSADFDDIERLLTKAFHEGAIVIIDEVNTFNSSPEALVSIERLLNTLLSGTDLNGTKATIPGFMLIGTQNPAGRYYGRAKETFAFANRLEKNWMPTMTTASLQATLMQKGCPMLLAKRLVEEYQYLRQSEINENALFIRNPRDLFAEVSGINPRIERAKQFYRLWNQPEFDAQTFFGSLQQRLPIGDPNHRNIRILSYLFSCKQQINRKNNFQKTNNSVIISKI